MILFSRALMGYSSSTFDGARCEPPGGPRDHASALRDPPPRDRGCVHICHTVEVCDEYVRCRASRAGTRAWSRSAQATQGRDGTNMSKRFAIVIGMAAAGVMAFGAQASSAASTPSTATYHADFTTNDAFGAHNGTWVGKPHYTTGVTGAGGDGAFAFTGKKSAIVMDQSVGAFGTDVATISFDVQTTYAGSNTQSLMGARSVCGNPSEGWWDIRTGPFGVIVAEFGGGGSYVEAKTDPTNLANGQCHHVVVHRDNSGVTVTIDGVLHASASGAPANINPSVPFAVDNSPCIKGRGTASINGNIDEINITRGA